MTEAEARTQGRRIRIAKMPMSYVARALEMDEPRGFMKAVGDAETGEILGCAVLGGEGGGPPRRPGAPPPPPTPRSPSLSTISSTSLRTESASGSDAAALLVLLAAAARAGLVAADLACLGGNRSRRGGVEGLPGRRARGVLADPGGGPAIPRGGRCIGRGLCRDLRDGRLETEEILDRLLLDPIDHGVKALPPLPVILDQGVSLTVPSAADAFLRVAHGQEMVLPLDVHHLKHEDALE